MPSKAHRCGECLRFTPSEKMAGGRCELKGKKAVFPDATCSFSDKFQAKPEPVKPDMIGPDPDQVWP